MRNYNICTNVAVPAPGRGTRPLGQIWELIRIIFVRTGVGGAKADDIRPYSVEGKTSVKWKFADKRDCLPIRTMRKKETTRAKRRERGSGGRGRFFPG